LALRAVNAGVPQEIRNLTVGFRYNNLDSVRSLFAAHPGQIAAVISSPPAMRSRCQAFSAGSRTFAGRTARS